MRQTLFTIPHYLFEGWLLGGWLLVGLAVFAYLLVRHGWTRESLGFLPIYAIGAALIYFVFPRLEIMDFGEDGTEQTVGLAVRGYGLMLLLGIASGIGLTVLRGKQLGIQPDRVVSFSFWMIVCGVVGARLFYVIQKWDQFAGQPLPELMGSVLNMTQGGLVVYGSVIGGVIGGGIYLMRAKLPFLTMADIAAPGMAIGLAIGRLGCLMNGCCYGGLCTVEQVAIEFPPRTPPYSRHLETGLLLGISPSPDIDAQTGRETGWLVAESVEQPSIAARHGVEAGDKYKIFFDDAVIHAIKVRKIPVKASHDIEILKDTGERVSIPIAELPERALPIHPTQLYSAVNAALLSAVLWFFFPYRQRPGRVFALMLILYSITRFLLEFVRQDELGQFGTALTISQWISMVALGLGVAIFFVVRPEQEPPDPIVT